MFEFLHGFFWGIVTGLAFILTVSRALRPLPVPEEKKESNPEALAEAVAKATQPVKKKQRTMWGDV